jgi:hypothetical protein
LAFPPYQGFCNIDEWGYEKDTLLIHPSPHTAAISQGVGKVEWRFQEDQNLRGRINELAENLAKGRKRILI